MQRGLTALLFSLFTLFWHGAALAENMFEPANGELVLPVTQLDDNTAYTTRWSLSSTAPLVWSLASAVPVSKASRNAALYDADNGSLWIPEINVNGKLYGINLLRQTENCDAPYCLTPDAASLQNLGRSGEFLYTSALSSASTFSCSSCHALEESSGFAADGWRRPGHALLNATRRPHFKNGGLDSLLEAVNICLTEWMNTAPWTAEDRDWINLNNWLDDQATLEAAEPVSIEYVRPPADTGGGDAITGRELFNSRCIVCHGEDGVGTQQAPAVAGTGLDADYIARRVRTSGLATSQAYDGLTGGIMPFWGADRLGDGELIDIIAYLTATDLDLPDLDMGDTESGQGCTADHPRVGQRADFNGDFHDVAGTAVIIDDCTIELQNFNFDGGGIVVQIYAGNALRFLPEQGGFAVSQNLVGRRYEDATLRITLEDGITLDDFDSLSVWCVSVSVSFGDLRFPAL